jgi:hypothetical protein
MRVYTSTMNAPSLFTATHFLRLARQALVYAADRLRAAGHVDAVSEVETVITVLDRWIVKAHRS